MKIKDIDDSAKIWQPNIFPLKACGCQKSRIYYQLSVFDVNPLRPYTYGRTQRFYVPSTDDISVEITHQIKKC